MHRKDIGEIHTLDLALAIGHHLLIFALFGVLLAELVIMHAEPGPAEIAKVQRIDLWYGILAAAILALGFSRASPRRQGLGLLRAQHLVLGEGRDVPRHWRALGAANGALPPLEERGRTAGARARRCWYRRLLWAQVGLFALLPVFAAAMARGYGEVGG